MTESTSSKWDLSEMVNHIHSVCHLMPSTAVILGSGLGHLVDHVTDAVIVSYHDIPQYPISSVEGHSGELVVGILDSVPVLIASGRFHMYEGYNMETVMLPIRLFHSLGVRNLITTNASGSVRKDFLPGTLMVLEGHIDCTFRESSEMPKIVRGTQYHSTELIDLARRIAEQESINVQTGVYAWTLGPSFETPAEIRMIQQLGGDSVGMSTVPEIQMAKELGLRTLGISCLTNYAAGITEMLLTHEEVIETANQVSQEFTDLLKGIISRIEET